MAGACNFRAASRSSIAKTEKFQTWSLPPELNGPHVQVNQVSPERSYVDGKVWLQDAGTYNVFRLDIATGKFERFEPYKIPRPNVYDVIPGFEEQRLLPHRWAPKKSGGSTRRPAQIEIFKTPTQGLRPAPRDDGRPRIDLWFGENRSDKIGMFDTRTESLQGMDADARRAGPTTSPSTKNGEVWSGGEYNDRIMRLDPKTGTFSRIPACPGHTNVRRVFVDNKTTPVDVLGGQQSRGVDRQTGTARRQAGAVHGPMKPSRISG